MEERNLCCFQGFGSEYDLAVLNIAMHLWVEVPLQPHQLGPISKLFEPLRKFKVSDRVSFCSLLFDHVLRTVSQRFRREQQIRDEASKIFGFFLGLEKDMLKSSDKPSGENGGQKQRRAA